jgi:hypothetical protein
MSARNAGEIGHKVIGETDAVDVRRGLIIKERRAGIACPPERRQHKARLA